MKQFKSKLKYYIPTSLNHIHDKIIICILIELLLNMVVPASAMKEPWQYSNVDSNLLCERIAKDYQNGFGGDLILIQPLNSNGAFDLGEYSGHWMNKAYSKERGVYYVDYWSGTYFKTPKEIQGWYFNKHQVNSVVFDYNKGEIPFGIIWHY